uniref:Wee1-like protein kinase n=2 Tax=Strigamia maritima TaxID=126957 RepID=T1JB71_STRMM
MTSHLKGSEVFLLPQRLHFMESPRSSLPMALISDSDNTTLFSSMDFDDSFNASTEEVVQSPLTRIRSPRKMRPRSRMLFDEDRASVISSDGNSPPYKRVRALNLFDSPQSPKSLLQSSAENGTFSDIKTPVRSSIRGRLFSTGDSANSTSNPPRARAIHLLNINPFTPTAMMASGCKRPRSAKSKFNVSGDNFNNSIEDFEDFDDDDPEPTKKIVLSNDNTSRYQTEFYELCLIGSGEFGSVYKCINRIDGCIYALKKSLQPISGCMDEQTALNEVYAHAVLGKHQHVVRYYSAWSEESRMVIQNEYCNGGSLADAIAENERIGRNFSENELKTILLHISRGLQYIHSNCLAHLDIKPGKFDYIFGNIFISRNIIPQFTKGEQDDGFGEEDECDELVTYKIGDLGHVTSITNSQVEEGDCRYLPCEILQDNHAHLPKADVFALGLTIYEAGGGGPLPKNGDEWHDIRNGRLPVLERYSADLNALLKEMVQIDPAQRPTAASLSTHRVLCPSANKSKAQLRRELNAERLKNEQLVRQLREAARSLEGLTEKTPPARITSRSVGYKVNRSHSVTNF